MSNTITLLSGLGRGDASVSVAKAMLMRHAPNDEIVDISHHAGNDLQRAAYLLLSAYRHFPSGTIHLLPVNIFSGNPHLLLAEKNGHYFIAPDNGVLPLAFSDEMAVRSCFEFNMPFYLRDWIQCAALIVETIRKGDSATFALCKALNMPRLLPGVMRDGVDCNMLYVDRYENVVLDITKHQFNELIKDKPFRIKLMRSQDITTISNKYNDVPRSAPLCRFNNASFLEIAFNHGKAATALGLSSDTKTQLRYRKIKIFTP